MTNPVWTALSLRAVFLDAIFYEDSASEIPGPTSIQIRPAEIRPAKSTGPESIRTNPGPRARPVQGDRPATKEPSRLCNRFTKRRPGQARRRAGEPRNRSARLPISPHTSNSLRRNSSAHRHKGSCAAQFRSAVVVRLTFFTLSETPVQEQARSTTKTSLQETSKGPGLAAEWM